MKKKTMQDILHKWPNEEAQGHGSNELINRKSPANGNDLQPAYNWNPYQRHDPPKSLRCWLQTIEQLQQREFFTPNHLFI